jgi:hypothetical protein
MRTKLPALAVGAAVAATALFAGPVAHAEAAPKGLLSMLGASGQHKTKVGKSQPMPTPSMTQTPSSAPSPTPLNTATPSVVLPPPTVAVTPVATQTADATPTPLATGSPTPSAVTAPALAAALPCTRHVSPSGSDSSAGTSTSPWATLQSSLSKLKPGDVLCVRGGTYAAPSLTVPRGTAAARITVQPEGSATPVVVGATSLMDPDHWTIRGLKWTNPGSTDRIVTILAGSSWIFEGNEVTDGAYAGLLVGKSTAHGNPHDYTVRFNVMHDTAASNFYHNPGRESRGGLIERNLFYNSGTQNLKIGWGGTNVCTGTNYSNFGIGEVVVRYNTMHNAKQPFAVAESGGELPIEVYRNLFTGTTSTYAVRLDNVEGCLKDNVNIYDNLGHGGSKFVEDFGDAPAIKSKMRGNVFPHSPLYDSTTLNGFRPQSNVARGYGRYAGSL